MRLFTQLVLFVCLVHLCTAEAEPRNLSFSALNLNLSLTWNAVELSLLENESILYTVVYHDIRQNRKISSCFNITYTTCCLVPFFPTIKHLHWYERFHVSYSSNVRSNVKGESEDVTFYSTNVEISAPVVQNISINSRNISLAVHGPETPYELHGRKLFMGDADLTDQIYLNEVQYNSSLLNLDNPSDAIQTRGWTHPISRSEARFKFLYLHPYTRYVIKLQSRIGSIMSKDVETYEFRTLQEEPEFGPTVSNYLSNHSCDYRDIRIFWKKKNRANAGITHYIVSCNDTKSNERRVITVPSADRSVLLLNLSRWRVYEISVTAVNINGSKEGSVYVINEDELMEDEYKIPEDSMVISPESNHQWKLTWEPPINHELCIVGYKVVTYINGAPEQQIKVDGYNTSSAQLFFRKVGRYYVDLSPIVNDSMKTSVSTIKMYTAKDWKLREWLIVLVVTFLICVLLTSLILLTRKALCDISLLPDISKSKSMRLISNNDEFINSLKSPPEKELFHSPRRSSVLSSRTVLASVFGDELDDVFEPKPSTVKIPPKPLSNCNPKYQVEMDAGKKHVGSEIEKTNHNLEITSSEVNQHVEVKDEGPSTMLPITSNVQSRPDGYVAQTFKVKPVLTVYIPKSNTENTDPRLLSAQSSFSDSGISSSAYSGSFSDYVPPSPFSDTEGSQCTWYGYDFKTTSPYMKAEFARRPGQIQSTSLSSDPGDESMTYKRLDTNMLPLDLPNGYLVMNPVSDLNDPTLAISSSCDSYSKPRSPKKFSKSN